jgi:hypothetical protein
MFKTNCVEQNFPSSFTHHSNDEAKNNDFKFCFVIALVSIDGSKTVLNSPFLILISVCSGTLDRAVMPALAPLCVGPAELGGALYTVHSARLSQEK